jgi:ankyrin repeat protein
MSTELINAARSGAVARVRALIADGVDVHADWYVALCTAACSGHVEVVRELIAAGANVHACENEALRIAAICGHVEVVRILLDAGAEPTPQAVQLLARHGEAWATLAAN